MNCVETYMEDSAPEQLSRRVTRMVRRKRYDRVPLESSSYSRFAVRMPRKLKVAKLDFRPVKRIISPFDAEDPAAPTLWGKLRDAYATMMADELDSDKDSTIVPALKKDRSLGKTAEILPTEHDIGFTLSVLEESYSDHLRTAFEGRFEMLKGFAEQALEMGFYMSYTGTESSTDKWS